jgi:hypothetical protein
MFSMSADEKRAAREKGLATQRFEIDVGVRSKRDSFVYWASPEGRYERAMMGAGLGGKASYMKKTGVHGMSPEKRAKACSNGGKAAASLIRIRRDGKDIRVKPELLNAFLEQGYVVVKRFVPEKRPRKNPGVWWNDGVVNTRSQCCPGPNFKAGRFKSGKKGKPRKIGPWWTNGVKNVRSLIPPDTTWVRGKTHRQQ